MSFSIHVRGNSVQSLQIQDEDGKNVCSGISPKNRHIANMFVASEQMLEILGEVKADILNFDTLTQGTYKKLNDLLNSLEKEQS